MTTDAIMGTFVSLKTMSDGTPRITLEMQCTLAEVAKMGLIPGVPFALARLNKGAANKAIEEPIETEKKDKPGPLCIMACNFCDDPLFWEWLNLDIGYGILVKDGPYTKEISTNAKEIMCDYLGIESRKEIDGDKSISEEFHAHFRIPFLEWKRDYANKKIS